MNAATYLTAIEGISHIRSVTSDVEYSASKMNYATAPGMLGALADIEQTVQTIREVIAFDSDETQPVEFGCARLSA